MIRPVAAEISQRFGDNPTRNLPASSWLIQTFGNYQPDGHTGEDYACPVGTPVRAVTSGTVLHIGWMGGTYDQNPWWIQPSFAGYHAVIDHGSFIGIYGHCSDGSAKVSKGDRVAEGQVFILSGNTGGSTGPHLHFEILPDGYVLNSTFYGRIDPEPLFAGSLAYAGTVTTQAEPLTPLEDELSAGDVAAIIDAVQKMHDVTRDYIPGATWKHPIDYRNPVTGELQRGATTAETVLSYVDTNTARIVDATKAPSDIAQQINAAGLAQAVRDELVKLLGGK